MSIEKCTFISKAMEEQRKKFGMELLPSLHKKLKATALNKDIPLWAATQEAVEHYLAPNHIKAPSEKYKGAHDLLQFILDNGTEDDIDWITGNLKNFGEAIRARKPVAKQKHGT